MYDFEDAHFWTTVFTSVVEQLDDITPQERLDMIQAWIDATDMRLRLAYARET